MKLTLISLIFVFLFSGRAAQAGFVELGLSANSRLSTIDEDNYQQSLSYTGSFSYYFWELSALELSYTNGQSILALKTADTADQQEIKTEFELIGLDLVLTFAGRKSAFQPYIKVGGAHLKKTISRKVDGFPAREIASPEGMVPSAGIGLKIRLSETISIKTGLDAWTSVPVADEPKTVDYSGRLGISWIF